MINQYLELKGMKGFAKWQILFLLPRQLGSEASSSLIIMHKLFEIPPIKKELKRGIANRGN
ncbi:hypothetical protein ABIE66_005276 [Peribacillus sp. B2I2]|uniref:hypothetical protein n=1 Tax=Peribacillus sp. B2I2 TaxID=3156468 RepID=UPI003517DA99